MSAPESRREFLRVSGATLGALVIGIPSALTAPLRRLDAATVPDHDGADALSSGRYVRIDTDGTVTIVVARSEMGQGARTALPMILAEELGADWQRVRLVQAEPSATFRMLSTGGSEAVSSHWTPLRQAGAAAREMLCSAAATRWGVPVDSVRAVRGTVVHEASQRSVPFGELVTAAAALPVPKEPALGDSASYTLVGKPMRRVDGPAIVHGTATYGLDVRVPGMLFASVEMPPVPGATVVKFNAAAARAVSGVRDVVEVPTGIAVVAESTWAALKGRRALAVVWNEGANATFDSTVFRATLRARTATAGSITARQVGDAPKALAASPAARRIEATYESPFQAHATMEPQNCTAHVTGTACTVWVGTQEPGDVQRSVAKALGLTPEQVTVHVTLLGGGFGRRIVNDNAPDAALLSRKMSAPVQVVWSRTDDFAHDWYQPMSAARLSATLGPDKRPQAWQHRIVAPAVTASFGGTVAMEAETLGALDVPYSIPNVRVEYTHVPTPVNMGWWRAIEYVPNVFAREAFLDELAVAAGMDALDYRLMLLDETSLQDLRPAPGTKGPAPFNVDRLRRVLQEVAVKAGWHMPLPKGVGRGLACLSYDNRSYVAQVAEVDTRGGRLKVRKIVTAIDVGLVVNPLGLTAQVESAVAWALTATLHGDMRFARGRAARTSFAEYRVTGLTDMPAIETHIMPPDYPPSGAGEPPVPAIAPAIVNAIFAATGKRVRSLPVSAATLFG